LSTAGRKPGGEHPFAALTVLEAPTPVLAAVSRLPLP
jgi:hypothetical protein